MVDELTWRLRAEREEAKKHGAGTAPIATIARHPWSTFEGSTNPLTSRDGPRNPIYVSSHILIRSQAEILTYCQVNHATPIFRRSDLGNV
jgi:hypothetical protein